MRLDIVGTRLANHRLGRLKEASPAEVVAHLGAVQSQDYPAAKWSVGLRLRRAADADVEHAFNEGAILRTHVMRPTWHFVTPQDIHSLLALTASRVLAGNARRQRDLGLDGAALARCHRILERSLKGGSHLTRTQLGERLSRPGFQAAGPRLAYILMHAELEELICSGPRRGRQFTYALLDERAPGTKAFDRGEALAGWTLRYFTSHGPAQLKDFAWWSGLTIREAQEGVEAAAGQLARETVDGKAYWFAPEHRPPQPDSPQALLLSIFDEYVIAYRDRSDLAEGRYLEKLLSSGTALTSVLVLDGRIAGTWKRTSRPGKPLEIAVDPFRPLRPGERKALRDAIAAHAAFLGVAQGAA